MIVLQNRAIVRVFFRINIDIYIIARHRNCSIAGDNRNLDLRCTIFFHFLWINR